MFLNGLFWNGIEKFGGKILNLLVSITLARLLTPADFGLVATLLVFTQLARVIQESGFRQALIREKHLTMRQSSSVFFINGGVGIALYCILYLCAPSIATFFDSTQLTNLARVIFLVLPISSLGIVQAALLNKSSNFAALARCTITASVTSGSLAIFLAYWGYGVWSLVAQQLTMSTVHLVLLHVQTTWRPRLEFSWSAVHPLFHFSRNLLFSGIIDSLVSNAQTIIIGKSYTPAELGYYSQAKQFSNIPAQSMTSVVNQVSYPFLVKFQEKDTELKTHFQRLLKFSVFLISSVLLLLSSMGDSIILLVLGSQWSKSIVYFQLLALGGSVYPLYTLGNNLLWVKGAGVKFLRLSIIKRVITLGCIIVAVEFGPIALVAGGVFSAFINAILSLSICGKVIDFSLKEQLRTIAPSYLSALTVAVLVYLSGSFMPNNSLPLKVLSQMLIGFISWLIINQLCNKTTLTECRALIHRFIAQKMSAQ